ncbi:hypothetical protein PF006_g4101 [Phytophthora fragariae]|uniref:Uncharacterized protein n=1 Tax=Phytophthora fragariae TaxID=53985 RepID=A0A6A3ULU6_9STRA|nr:hypothetical protein PF006_g4101 [Phytophthora fragariae]
MTRERFTINPFPALSLSGEEKAQLLQLGRTLIQANFERDMPFFKSGRKVDFKRWKLARERENMSVYTERPGYTGADALSDPSSSKLPAILSVGRVPGSLDDMMYGVVNPTLEEMRIKASAVEVACAQIMENGQKSRYVVGAPTSNSTSSVSTSSSSEGMSIHSFN